MFHIFQRLHYRIYTGGVGGNGKVSVLHQRKRFHSVYHIFHIRRIPGVETDAFITFLRIGGTGLVEIREGCENGIFHGPVGKHFRAVAGCFKQPGDLHRNRCGLALLAAAFQRILRLAQENRIAHLKAVGFGQRPADQYLSGIRFGEGTARGKLQISFGEIRVVAGVRTGVGAYGLVEITVAGQQGVHNRVLFALVLNQRKLFPLCIFQHNDIPEGSIAPADSRNAVPDGIRQLRGDGLPGVDRLYSHLHLPVFPFVRIICVLSQDKGTAQGLANIQLSCL